MTAREAATVLEEISVLLELHGEDAFRSRAYARASRALETAEVDLEEAHCTGSLASIPGIGKALAAELAEIIDTGSSAQLDRLREATPPGLLDILKIRGLGPKKVRRLWVELGVISLDDLSRAAEENRIAALSGFGAKSQEKILQGVRDAREREGKLRLSEATVLAESIVAALRATEGVTRADVAGRLRRGAEEIQSLSFVVSSQDPDAVADALAALDVVSNVSRTENLIGGFALDRIPLTVEAVDEERFAITLHQRTGAGDYLFMMSLPLHDRGYVLDHHGLFRDGAPVALNEESDLFDLIDLPFIPPELREGIDEVPLALEGALPELVRPEDVRGVLHVHSVWSDGHNTIEELAEAARAAGYGYLLMCDHSKAAFYANGLDEDRVAAQGREIDAINERYDPKDFRVLKGIECDILADGAMDLSDDCLATLDAVVASVHSRFNLPLEEQTERICAALRNPHVTILGHPTGRLILRRDGYALDIRRVIDTASEFGKSIELNANPSRLDLAWRMLRYARHKGVLISINPDAHSTGEFANIRYGVTMARKGGLRREDILNTLECDGFLAHVAGRDADAADRS